MRSSPSRAVRPIVAGLCAAALLITACGSQSSGPASSEGPGTSAPLVVVTTSIWADITANVACDGLAQVEMIIPPGGDPHSFEPSLRDRETMESASLIVANGLLLEESLEDTIDAVESSGVPVVRVAESLDTIPIGARDEMNDGDAEHDDGDAEHGHGDADPHVWWDPTLVAAGVPVIVDAMVAVGIDRASLDVCAQRYGAELTELDNEVASIVAPLPVDQRVLVTNHDALEYFAARYNFDVLGSVIPSSSSLAATNPAELDALADAIETLGVPAIFAETQQSSADADALANRIGGIEIVELLTGTLGEPESEAATYVDWLRFNTRAIVDALSAAS